MVSALPLHRYTFEQYLTLEKESTTKHEYLEGEIVAMAGGTPEHAALAMALGHQLSTQLASTKCRVFSSDLRVRVAATGLTTYPDVSVVVCVALPNPDRSHATFFGVDTLDDALRVIASMNEAGVDYVIVGGVAMNLHGLVRATEGLDIFIRPDAGNVERLRQALRTVWNDPSIDELTAEDLCGDYPAVRYGPPEGSLYLDILTRLGEATLFKDLEVEETEVAGIRVRVASPRTLYRMKKGTVRPIDHADAAALRTAFDLDD